jgi:hypothetical protein
MQQNIQDTLQGKYLDSNPYLDATVNRALDNVQTRVNSQFAGNNYGSSAHEEWLARNLAGTALPFYSQNYQNERTNQLRAAAMAPDAAAQDYLNISNLSNAGTAEQNLRQQQLNAQISNYYKPWDLLQNYQRLVTGSNAGGTTSSSSTSPYYTNPLATGLGLATGGLGLYNAANTAGLFGSTAPAIAAGAGIGYGAAGTAIADAMIPTALGLVAAI